MAKFFVPPPSLEHLISYFVEWCAKNMRAKITVNVVMTNGDSWTEEIDGRHNVQGQGEDTSAACGRSPAP